MISYYSTFFAILMLTLSYAQGSSNSNNISPNSDVNKIINDAIHKGGAKSTSIRLPDPVARVNGESISRATLEKNFSEAVVSAGASINSLTADQKLQGYYQILDGMILENLVDKASKDISVDKSEVEAQIAKIKSQFPSEDVFLKEMKNSGVNMDDFTKNVTRSLRQNKWMQSQVNGKDAVTEDEEKKFYDNNPKEFMNPELVHASHILFRTLDNATTAQIKEAENKAKMAIERANKGEPFDKLAKELSEEPGAAQRGGDLGFFSKDKMVPEFADAAFSQKVGSISQIPIKTKFGYHVIKVIEKKPAGKATFAEAKDQIFKYLQLQKQRECFRTILQKLRQAASIEINLPPLPPQSMPELKK